LIGAAILGQQDRVLEDGDLAGAVVRLLLAVLALEARQPGPALEEIPERLVEVDAGLLQGHGVEVGQPSVAAGLLRHREELLQVVDGGELLPVHLVAVALHGRCLVVDEAHGAKLPAEELGLLGHRVDADLRGAKHSRHIEHYGNKAKLSRRRPIPPRPQGRGLPAAC
jgi:hypothetical protein